MRVEKASPVKYFLRLGENEVSLNDFLGRDIELAFNGQINCIACGRLTNKSFAGGFCFPCMQNSPMNSECIIRPELCEAHLGKGRDPEWEKENHLVPHTVYLALSSAVKVGVTRDSQVPTRWIDQGATAAVKLASVPNRYLAGEIEVFLKQYLTDKTAWQRMLKNEIAKDVSLNDVKGNAKEWLAEKYSDYISNDDEVMELEYPVSEYPEKVKSVTFDKEAIFSGKLRGIKGQYLIMEDERVLNVRRHSGYYVNFRA